MELTVDQTYAKKVNCEYKIRENGNIIYKAALKRTILFPSLNKIYLYEPNGKEICILKQEDKVKFICEMVPIISMFSSICPYIYYKNGVKQGYIIEQRSGSDIMAEIQDKRYEIWQHTAKDVSIYYDNIQVAAIKKARWDRGEYKFIYEKSLEKELGIMFCLFSDFLFNVSSPYNDIWVKRFGGRKFDADWKPKY